MPIGVNAQISADEITVRAIVGLPDASEFIEDKMSVARGDVTAEKAAQIGANFADKFIAKGAKELLARAEKMA